MEHNVTIEVEQVVKREGQKECFSYQTMGQWLKKESAWIRYQEQIESATVDVTLKVLEGSVKLIRNGDIRMNLHFVEGQETTTFYELPYGKMLLTVQTLGMNHFVSESGGRLKIHYVLFQDDEKVGTYQYEIKYKER
ncbi:DUF1934 domain-containing protein [Staphylococcus lutrae]|uniref:DUF1934 domain-containing protein n=1 Tax=Staphylococcus lutrae TaxID=155085 RepID=A0AAC9WJJ8_9STAP|nr:DUF1934 family protein [Staphylococcus lutrae]ARJ51153.1 hypothetical protein B5P37_07460 [Staphylococcus lutrae]PNZ37921.1 DUF1934 domain-containing protein [Staphylococcus lutrae]